MRVVSFSFNFSRLRSKELCELRDPSRFYKGPKENLSGAPKLVQSLSLPSKADLADWGASDQHTKETQREIEPGTRRFSHSATYRTMMAFLTLFMTTSLITNVRTTATVVCALALTFTVIGTDCGSTSTDSGEGWPGSIDTLTPGEIIV